jgi:imidazolonepropionase-like amidohydrolase
VGEAGVTVLAGTDGAAGIIADEVDCLVAAGVPADVAVGGASWVARSWLGFGGLEHGALADIVGYDEDPRAHPDVLRRPSRILLRGRVVAKRRLKAGARRRGVPIGAVGETRHGKWLLPCA